MYHNHWASSCAIEKPNMKSFPEKWVKQCRNVFASAGGLLGGGSSGSSVLGAPDQDSDHALVALGGLF